MKKAGEAMRTDRAVMTLAIAALGGWLVSVMFCNWLFYNNIVNYEVLYRGVADSWSRALSRGRSGKISLLLIRILQVGVAAGITRSRFRRAGSLILGAGCGFGSGLFLTLLVWSLGLPGGAVFLGAGFPQALAYLPCIFVLLIGGYSGQPVQKDRLISVTVGLLAAGIWLELYANPFFLKLF